MSQAMVPLSGRIEDDLYAWFVSLDYPGAKTNSDKLREALKALRAQQQATEDLVHAQAWMHAMSEGLRTALLRLERDQGAHSEIMESLLTHITAMAAIVLSARPASTADAAQVEAQLVRRAMTMTEALLRHGLTSAAKAFGPEVIRRHSPGLTELVTLIHQAQQGEKHG